jgi:hypothetical protein
MTVIKNLTNSAIDLPGGRILPAYGETEATDADGLLRYSPAVAFIESDDTLGQWRDMYKELTGKDADKRWTEATITARIEELTG